MTERDESMVERVAEAIMKVEAEDKISDYYKFARAAIAAMRDTLQAKSEQTSEYWATVDLLDEALK